MWGETATEMMEEQFCLFFAETALQLLSGETGRKVKSTIRLFSDANFEESELCWLVKKLRDYKPIPDDSKTAEIAGERFKKEILRSESNSMVCGAVLFKREFVTVLQRQRTMSLSQDVSYICEKFKVEQGTSLLRHMANVNRRMCKRK